MKRLYWAAGIAVAATLVGAILLTRYHGSSTTQDTSTGIGTGDSESPRAALSEPVVRASRPEQPAPVDVPKAASPIPTIGREPVPDLLSRRLQVPVKDIKPSELFDSFDDARGGRKHEAIDILAPRNTPVVAVEDGKVEKLFTSKAGGLTIYQFDPTSTYVYYYAHLERYADQLREDSRVRRGEVIGYVGTSGNAPKNTPHLHFAIFKMTEARKWWEGAPIDPFTVLAAASGTPR